MMKLLKYFFPLLFLTSCYYDVEEVLYAGEECNTEAVSYQDDIRLIFDTHCMICHNASSNFGNVKLETYAQVVTRVESGELLGVIRHDPGFSPMPQGNPKIPECQIRQIESWIDDGYPQN